MDLPILLVNKFLTKLRLLSASNEYDQFIDQPVKSINNTGSLTLAGSGSYRGTADLNIKTEIKVAGDIGTSKFIFSADGGSAYYGLNKIPIFEDFEVVTESI